MMKHTALWCAALGALCCAASAQAADVQVYGRVDAGLLYKHTANDDNLTMNAGGRAHNRIGLNIVEDLGNGMKVKAYLENGFTLDDGAMDDGKTLFNRRSILAVQGSWGEVGFGRMGTVQSTMAPYSMGSIKFDPFGTSYGNASVGKTFSNTSRTNNTVTWVSPKMNGFRVGASYSLGDATDDTYNVLADRKRTGALAIDYTGDNVYLTLNYGVIDYGNAEGAISGKDAAGNALSATKDSKGQAVAFGGWYRFIPESKIFFGAQYSTHWTTGGSLAASKVAKGSTQHELDVQAEGWDGCSLLLGADYVIGEHKVIAGVQHYNGELSADSSIDFLRTIVAAAYEYKLAKTTWLYFAATHSIGGGAAEAVADAAGTTDVTEVFAGLNWNF